MSKGFPMDETLFLLEWLLLWQWPLVLWRLVLFLMTKRSSSSLKGLLNIHTHTHTHTHIKKRKFWKSISRQHIRKLITLKTQWANNKTPICSAVNKLYSRLQHWWWSKRLQHLYCFHRDSNKPLIKSLSKLQHITESNCAVCWEFVCWQNLVLYIKKGTNPTDLHGIRGLSYI